MPGRELGTSGSPSQPTKRRSSKHRSPLPSRPMPTILETDDHRPLRDLYSPAAERSQVISGVPANRGSFFSGQGTTAPICLALYAVADQTQPDQKRWGSRLDSDEEKVSQSEDSLTLAGDAMAEALLSDISDLSDTAPGAAAAGSKPQTPPLPQLTRPAAVRRLVAGKRLLSDSDADEDSGSDVVVCERESHSKPAWQLRKHSQWAKAPDAAAGSYLAKAALRARSLRDVVEPQHGSETQLGGDEQVLSRVSSESSMSAPSEAEVHEENDLEVAVDTCCTTKSPKAVTIMAEARVSEVIQPAENLKAGKIIKRRPMFDTARDPCVTLSELWPPCASPHSGSPNSVLVPCEREPQQTARRKLWPPNPVAGTSSSSSSSVFMPAAAEVSQKGPASGEVQTCGPHSEPSVAQLAADLQRRQETLQQLISFYDSWVDKLGHHEVKAGPVPDLSRVSLEPSHSGEYSMRTLSSTTPPYDRLGSRRESYASAEDHALEVETSDMSASSALSELSGSLHTSESSTVLGVGQVKTVILSDSAMYRGTVVDVDVPHGLGRYQLKRWPGDNVGDMYQGEFTDGLIDGLGVYFFGGCGWYSGQWQHGRQHGFGKQIFANGTMYLGSFGKGGRLDGMGVCLYPSGDTYEGEIKEGLPHGQGYHKAADGGAYAGTFQEGRRCGLGHYRFRNGDQFAGEFRDDAPCGRGHYLTRFGEALEGDFLAGKAHGWGVRTLPDGAMAAGKWVNAELLWSRTIQRDSSLEELSDADMEGMDLAQETARSARHAAKEAKRAGKAARRCQAVTDAVRSAMAAAKQGDAASRRAAAVAQR